MTYRVSINSKEFGPYESLKECFYSIDKAYKEVEENCGLVSWSMEGPEGIYDGSGLVEGIWISIAGDAEAFDLYFSMVEWGTYDEDDDIE